MTATANADTGDGCLPLEKSLEDGAVNGLPPFWCGGRSRYGDRVLRIEAIWTDLKSHNARARRK